MPNSYGRNGYGKGTFIDTKMYLSDAYLSLGQRGTSPIVSAASVHILNMLLGKRKFSEMKVKGSKQWMRVDNNRFTLTYKEATSYGYRLTKEGKRVKGSFTQPQIARGFDELLAKGFIEIVEHGGAYEKHKSQYSLADDWKHWFVGDDPIRLRPKDRQRGYQGQGKGAAKLKTAHIDVATHTHANVGHPS